MKGRKPDLYLVENPPIENDPVDAVDVEVAVKDLSHAFRTGVATCLEACCLEDRNVANDNHVEDFRPAAAELYRKILELNEVDMLPRSGIIQRMLGKFSPDLTLNRLNQLAELIHVDITTEEPDYAEYRIKNLLIIFLTDAKSRLRAKRIDGRPRTT